MNEKVSLGQALRAFLYLVSDRIEKAVTVLASRTTALETSGA